MFSLTKSIFNSEVDKWFWQIDTQYWQPKDSVYEDDEQITVEIELPRVDPEDIDVSVDNNILTIKSKTLQKAQKNVKYHKVKQLKGSFVRVFTIPLSVNSDGISATYKHGVLTVVLPKRPETSVKQIEVKIL